MDGKEFIDYLKRRLNLKTDTQLAKHFGVSVATIGNWQKNKITNGKIFNMMQGLEKAAGERRNIEMAVNLFNTLSVDAPLKHSLKEIGITPQTAHNWRRKGLNADKLNGLFKKIRMASIKSANSEAIKPICEFVDIDRVEAPRSEKWQVLGGEKSATDYFEGLIEELKEVRGIYVFYDSRGRALYVGKAVKQSVWAEMNSAYNRSRDAQNVYRVYHPKRNHNFSPQYEKMRRVQEYNVTLSEMARYFSVYEVSTGMTGNLEALLIRAFANDLLNVRMERFS